MRDTVEVTLTLTPQQLDELTAALLNQMQTYPDASATAGPILRQLWPAHRLLRGGAA